MRRLTLAIVLAACGDDGGTGVDAGVDVPGVPVGCMPDRATADRPDDNRYDQIRVVYVLPADLPDEGRDTSGQICNSVRAFATWFHAQAGVHLRFDTSGGLLDIGFARLGKTDAVMRGNDPDNRSVELGTAYVRNRIESELITMGQIESHKLYAVYYEGSSLYACGAGTLPPHIIGKVAAMYLDGLPMGQTVLCGESFPWGQASLVPSYIDYGMLHEIVHSLGIVPESAPNHHSFGHVFDRSAVAPNRDLLYSPRVGMNDPGWATNDPAGLILDLGKDDYFQASGQVELSTMSLLAPLPEGYSRPVGW